MEKRLIVFTHFFSIVYLLFICFPLSLVIAQSLTDIGNSLMTGSLASIGFVLYFLGSAIDPFSFYENGLTIGLFVAVVLGALEFFVFKRNKNKLSLVIAILICISIPILLVLHGIATATYK